MQKAAKFTITLTALATTLGAAAQIAMAQPIAVQVNNTPIQFSGTPPIERNGSVLVPLRGVFEAMGASVNYDQYSRTIFARQGEKTVTLPLNSSVATVNGQQETLSQPAQVIGGTTLVPLRFVAESLGAYVEWQSASNTVLIQPNGSPVAYIPNPAPVPVAANSVSGVIRSISLGQVVIHSNGQDQAIDINSQTALLQSNDVTPNVQLAWNDLAPGDFVVVKVRRDGVAASIAANYGVVSGRVGTIRTLPNGSQEILLRDGTIVPLSHNAVISKNGDPITFAQVMPGDRVTIRTNPNNDRGYDVSVGSVYAHRR